MARNDVVIDAAMNDVWNVVSDPRAYGYFVPGTRRIRAFDPRWPDVGTRIHHTLGIEPLVIRDESEVVESVPPRLLRLVASMGPMGAAEVVFRIEPAESGGARLVLEERPAGGLIDKVWNPFLDALMHVRNELSVRRVRAQVEGRRDRHGHRTAPEQARAVPVAEPEWSGNGRR